MGRLPKAGGCEKAFGPGKLVVSLQLHDEVASGARTSGSVECEGDVRCRKQDLG
jgi:hypothetical protein